MGYYYFRNRYMDPGLGRFVSRDPLGLWGDPLNLGNGYTYAASNPWTLVDPFGLEAGGNLIDWVKGVWDRWMDNDVPTTNYGQGEDINAAISRAASRGDQAGNDATDNYFLDGDPLDKSASDFLSAAGTDATAQLMEGAVDGAENGAYNGVAIIGGVGAGKLVKEGVDKAKSTGAWGKVRGWFKGWWNRKSGGPDPKTGVGYGVNDPPVRIEGEWSDADMTRALYGRPPLGLGSPDLHHADQMPGSGIHEISPSQHRTNAALHQNRYNQGVAPEMRTRDRQLHWWYRAREQGADQRLPDLIYDDK